MAEILIQRKRRRRVWPWLLSLVVLALLPLPFLGDRGEQRTVERPRPRGDTTMRRDTAAATVAAADSGAIQVPGAGVTAAASDGSAGAAARGQPATGQPAPGEVAAGARVTSPSPGGASPGSPSSSVASSTVGLPRERSERTTAMSAGTIAPMDTAPASRATSDRASFSRFTATTKAPTSERAHREYTADALDRLAAELRALGSNAAGVSVITAHADSLRMPNAGSAARPDYARAAFLGAVHQFDLLQSRNRGRVNVARMRSTAWAIDPRRSLIAQRATVERFFAAARDALDSLSRKS